MRSRISWISRRAPSRYVYVVAGALGLAICLAVYGGDHLIGNSSYWEMPEADERMATMGYRYFLAAPWHWPMFESHAINVPYAKSIAFLDVIPIWGVINKLIATIVPPWRSFSAHAYLGLWHALSYALQACFGVAIMRAQGHRTWSAGLLSALLFVAVPTWIFRYAHPALQAHWIELWALYLYLRTPNHVRLPGRLGVAMIAQLAVASLVSPYHPVISFAVFAASLMRSCHLRSIAFWMPLGLATVGFAAWCAGYFAVEGVKAQWGFDQESANLLGWLVPLRSGIVGNASWIANVDATGYQYEGYAYLGLGYLALLALFVKRIPAAVRSHVHLFAIIVGFCVLAVSNRVYFGSHEIVGYPIPSLLKWVPQQFRSPGRFVWLPSYVLIAFLLHQAFTRFASRRGLLVLTGIALVQLIDASGDWRFQRSWTSTPRHLLANHNAWRRLVRAHKAVFTVPAFSCSSGELRGQFDFVAMELQWFASERALPINGTYATRVRRRCSPEMREWATAPVQEDALYVAFPDGFAVADRFQSEGVRCVRFDYGRVCSTNDGAIDGAIRSRIVQAGPEPLRLDVGEELQLQAVALDGAWTAPEAGGRWTLNGLSGVPIRLDKDMVAVSSIGIEGRVKLCGARHDQDVDVLVDETLLGTLHFDNDKIAMHTLNVPGPALHGAAFTLQLRPRDTRSEATLRCGSDARRLGLWVSRIVVR